MDLIKFPVSKGMHIELQDAELVQNWATATWAERYFESGEFTLTADTSSGLEDQLPLKTIISHTGTNETMIVEDIQITTSVDESDKITVTGRSFETFLENRIVGSNRDWNNPVYPLQDVVIPLDRACFQAAELINIHIRSGYSLFDNTNGINNIAATIIGGLATESRSGLEKERVIKRGDVYKELIDILRENNLGIRSTRNSQTDTLYLEIHRGLDLSRSVSFSDDFGEIESADYLKTTRAQKNAVLVSGKFVEVAGYDNAHQGYDRRWMFVDASDVDGQLSESPTGPELTRIRQVMGARGQQALARQNFVSIMNPKLAKGKSRYKYREDYNVGDIVSVNGKYNSSTRMRVTEFVEVSDETGESSYPTLTDLQEN